jgi:hypothetical protein
MRRHQAFVLAGPSQRLRLNYEELLSTFASNLNTRRYIAASLILANSAMSGEYLHFWHVHIGPAAAGLSMSIHEWVNEGLMVGRCSLPVSIVHNPC